uniref:Uncharacterized protein n=1 Tax=Lactuca sativa TaxID=4236 RepID=A0A9R1UTI1_LACSA|nr:hypothetical protein LSAT_V11C800413450 [Lactuca sativa]
MSWDAFTTTWFLIKSLDFSVGIIILGAFVAGARDLSFDSYAYAIVFSANICTAIYLASIARIGLICTPILLLWTWACGDLQLTANFSYLSSPGFQDLFTIGLGWLLFGGLPFDLLNVVGQSLGFLGSCTYAFCKIKGL